MDDLFERERDKRSETPEWEERTKESSYRSDARDSKRPTRGHPQGGPSSKAIKRRNLEAGLQGSREKTIKAIGNSIRGQTTKRPNPRGQKLSIPIERTSPWNGGGRVRPWVSTQAIRRNQPQEGMRPRQEVLRTMRVLRL